jgi:hypothetical protein
MSVHKVLVIIALCAALCLCIGFFVDTTHAQNDNKAAKTVDKSLATKQGVSDSLAKGSKDSKTGATAVQMAIGIGSIFVMLAVLKWL